MDEYQSPVCIVTQEPGPTTSTQPNRYEQTQASDTVVPASTSLGSGSATQSSNECIYPVDIDHPGIESIKLATGYNDEAIPSALPDTFALSDTQTPDHGAKTPGPRLEHDNLSDVNLSTSNKTRSTAIQLTRLSPAGQSSTDTPSAFVSASSLEAGSQVDEPGKVHLTGTGGSGMPAIPTSGKR